MIRLLKAIGLALITSALFCSCSASWHLQRAEQKDPSMFTHSVDTIRVPELRIDTTVVLEKDTAGLSSFIDSLVATLDISDSCAEVIRTIKIPVLEYVQASPVLLDTVSYETTVDSDSMSSLLRLTIWQEADGLRVVTEVVKTTILVPHTTIVEDDGILSRQQEIILLILLAIAFFIILKQIFTK